MTFRSDHAAPASPPRRTAAMLLAEVEPLLAQAQSDAGVLAIIERDDVAKAMHSDNAGKSWHTELLRMVNKARFRVAPSVDFQFDGDAPEIPNADRLGSG